VPFLSRLIRPALAWWVLGALVAAAAVVTAVERSPAAKNSAACAGYGYGYGYGYGSTGATLTLAMSRVHIRAGRRTTATGALTGTSGCAFAGDTVLLQSRGIVGGSPTGAFHTVATRTTDADGRFSATFRPKHNRQFRAVAPATAEHTAATSNAVSVRVSTAIGLSVDRHHNCRVEFSGHTSPVKKGHRVRIKRHHSTLVKTTTNHRGRYDTSTTLTCGKRYRVTAHIGHDSTNAAGHSATHSVRPHHGKRHHHHG
jgi:hypothetical protein